MEKKVVLVTGGFDPLHSGHIAYFKEAKKLGNKLVVGLNSDEWLTRKKGKPFMPFAERAAIIQELECVDQVIGFNDDDNSACQAIGTVLATNTGVVVFANGGDRTNTTTPELTTYGKSTDVEFAWGVGGEDKRNSSSWILEEWKTQKTTRPWGWYRVLDKGENWAVKELTILPGKSLSDQRHHHRSEHWHVVSGEVTCDLEMDGWAPHTLVTGPKQSMDIEKMMWHRPYNTGTEPAKIIETWFGDILEETDIERREI